EPEPEPGPERGPVTPTTAADEEDDPTVGGPTAIDGTGLSGDRAARGPALAWGALAATVWLGAWLASKRVGRLIAYAVGAPVFLITLFVFFENFARLLPANV
ncbi:MAG: hypothetical protein ACRD0F_04005, partial [Acidimicrobiales bacterium]